jgi:Rrf2 family protein
VLQLTKRTEYGLIALVHLVDRSGQFVSAREIAEHYPVPRRLLAEVLKDLGRVGLVESQRGAAGGYCLARPADRITLGEVIAAVEGEPALTGCESLGNFERGACDVSPVCPIKSPIQRVRSGIWDLLQRTTLRDLARPGSAAQPRTDHAPWAAARSPGSAEVRAAEVRTVEVRTKTVPAAP